MFETVFKFDNVIYILDLSPRGVLFNNINNVTDIINKNLKVVNGVFYPKNTIKSSRDDLEMLKFLAICSDEIKSTNIREDIIKAVYNLAMEIYEVGTTYKLEKMVKDYNELDDDLKELIDAASFKEEIQKIKRDNKCYLPELDTTVKLEDVIEYWKTVDVIDETPSGDRYCEDGMRPKRKNYGPPKLRTVIQHNVRYSVLEKTDISDIVKMILMLIDAIYDTKSIAGIIYYNTFEKSELYDQAVESVIQHVNQYKRSLHS